MKEHQRQEAKARSEAELMNRVRNIETKSAEKEALLRRKMAENEEMRRLRSEVGLNLNLFCSMAVTLNHCNPYSSLEALDLTPFLLVLPQEARHRTDFITLHAQEAAERDEAERDTLRQRLNDKAARADALARQRRWELWECGVRSVECGVWRVLHIYQLMLGHMSGALLLPL